MKQFKCLDLFSGAGGISLGFKNVGVNISLSNDYTTISEPVENRGSQSPKTITNS